VIKINLNFEKEFCSLNFTFFIKPKRFKWVKKFHFQKTLMQLEAFVFENKDTFLWVNLSVNGDSADA
jgi:hypothetical protein